MAEKTKTTAVRTAKMRPVNIPIRNFFISGEPRGSA
jgi:hypothetical protein